MTIEEKSPATDPELQRATALLRVQQKMQGDADPIRTLAISRMLKAVPADTLSLAKSQIGSAPAAVAAQQAMQASDVFTSSAPGATGVQIPSNNGGMTMNPSATLIFGSDVEKLEFSSSAPQNFRELVMAGTQEGEVVFYVPVGWHFPTTGNRPAEAALVGSGLAHITVPFSIAADKDKPDQLVLTWRSPRTLALSSDGGGAALVQAPVTTDVTPAGGSATITPTLQFQEQLSHAVTTAGNTLSIGGGPTTPIFSETVTATSDVGGGHQEQSQVNVTDSFSMSFTANLLLPKAVPVDTSAALIVRFRVDSDSTASGGEEDKITQWYQGLDKKVRASIEAGRTEINLLGKASATGPTEHNRQLAHRRVQHVQDILADLAGSDAKFHTQATGRSQPHHTGEDPDERVVLVSLGESRPPSVVADE